MRTWPFLMSPSSGDTTWLWCSKESAYETRMLTRTCFLVWRLCSYQHQTSSQAPPTHSLQFFTTVGGPETGPNIFSSPSPDPDQTITISRSDWVQKIVPLFQLSRSFCSRDYVAIRCSLYISGEWVLHTRADYPTRYRLHSIVRTFAQALSWKVFFFIYHP